MFYFSPFLSLGTPFVMSSPEVAGIGLLNFLHLNLFSLKFSDEQSESQGFRLMKFRLTVYLTWHWFKLEEIWRT